MGNHVLEGLFNVDVSFEQACYVPFDNHFPSFSFFLFWLIKGETGEGGSNQQVWDKWSNDGTEQEVAKLMEEDVGAAMQFLQSKAMCIMPISLASAIYPAHQIDTTAPTLIKPEPNAPS